MQYTIRGIPPAVDAALRRRAKATSKSLNQAALEALMEGVGIEDLPKKRRDLSDIAGTWVEDENFDAVIADQRKVDPDLWR